MSAATAKTIGCTLAILAAVALAGGDASAAPNKPVVAHVSFGASLVEGGASDVLEDGWAIHGGATWFAAAKPFGFRLDGGVDWWDAKSSFLNTIDTDRVTLGIQPPDDGDAQAWSVTGDFIWEPRKGEKVSFYLLGGIGMYYVAAQITEYGYVGGYWCDYWYCYPYVGTGEFVIDDGSSWEYGWNAGAGIAVKTQAGWEWYFEATYHWLQTDNKGEYVPIQFGIRF